MSEEERRRDEARRRLGTFFREGLAAAEIDGPTSEDVAAYVDGSIDPADRAAFEELLALDPELRAEVSDLEGLRDSLRREASPRRPVALGGSVAAAAGLSALLFWHWAPPAGEPDATPSAPSATPILTLRDGDHEVALRADGSLAGLPGLSLEARADVMIALRSGDLPMPKALATLRGDQETLMGGADGAATFHVVAPIATFVRSAQPTFRWTPHPKARGYEVVVFGEDLVKVASVRVVSELEATAPSPLERGKAYLWQVAALTPAGRVIAPAPPAAEARFRVLGAPAAAALDNALAAAGDSHLAAGILLARAGVRDEAETHFARLVAANPDSTEARRLLDAFPH
jgi:hypothetical protein